MTSYIVIALFVLGIGFGSLFRDKETVRKKTDVAVSWAVYILLFLLGISVGVNKEIINNFIDIGYEALVLTLGALLGSLVLAKVLYKYFFKKGV